MPNPAETVLRGQELQAVLEPLRAALLRIPGCNSNRIGLTVAAFERLRRDAPHDCWVGGRIVVL
jgi:hypothetical protein